MRSAIHQLTGAAAVALSLVLLGPAAWAAGAANDHTVLILESTIVGGLSSPVAQEAIALGYDVEIATDAQWLAKSTADFETYRGLILGDPITCPGGTAPVAAAEASVNVWGPAVDGNVLIIGTDPAKHIQWIPHTRDVVESGMAYVLTPAPSAGLTGFYISMSCLYNTSGTGNAVAVLSYFGSFVVSENTACHDDIHITAPTHPAMNNLTDAKLSNWNCSIHALFTEWPANFLPLAIADGLGNEYTAPDGSTGTPYIFARAAGDCDVLPSITIISVTPDTLWSPNKKMIDIVVDANVVGTMVNVVTSVTSSETPKAPWTVYYQPGADAFHFKLRADRNGGNTGRTYTITFTGTDLCGNVATKTVTVVVPHDQRTKNGKKGNLD